MSDENREAESGEAGFSALPSVGGQLKAAREKKEMSVGDIAMALKLGQRQVEALENGDWERLPGHTFIRGFVRNYARLLQIDAAPLMEQLDGVLEAPQQRLVVASDMHAPMPEAGRPRRRDFAMVLIGIVLVLVAVGVYFLLPSDLSAVRGQVAELVASFAGKNKPTANPETPVQNSEPVFPPGSTPQQVMNPQAVTPPETTPAPEAASNTAPAPALVPPPVTQSEPATPAAQPQAGVPATPSAAAAAPAGSAALRFAFQQDSWVEVRDRSGKLLLSQRGRAGTEQEVSGQGPFSVIIGNAPGVKLTLRGQSVDLAAHTSGNVARLTVE